MAAKFGTLEINFYLCSINNKEGIFYYILKQYEKD
jgi:hypothetical protein